MKKYQRKMLAVFAAFLMVAFVASATMTPSGGEAQDFPYGKFGTGDEELLASDVERAKNSVELLSSIPARSFGGQLPLIFMLAPAQEIQQFFYARMIGQQPRVPQVIQQFGERPEMLALLLREARENGVSVGADQVNSLLQNEIQVPAKADAATRERYRQAVADLLTVDAAYKRAASNVIVSEPMRRRAMAEYGQNMTVEAVEFDAKDYHFAVGAPTTQQVNEQFEKFSNRAPLADDLKDNPFGFGYRYPNRVKLQYISVPRDAVRESIRAAKPTEDEEYAWTVKARKYYAENQRLFPATQPAATTDDASLKPLPFSLDANAGASATTKPTTGPTTKPFGDVRGEIIDRLVREETDRKVETILNKINTRLAQDWLAYQGAVATGATTRGAAVTVYGFPYTSYEYLQALAADIQKQEGVLPTVTSLADEYKSAEQLEKLPGIGKARFGGISFDDYAIQYAEAFVPDERKKDAAVLSRYEPSRVLTDDYDNAYVFRVSEMQPSQMPLAPGEVAAQVEADYRARAAYDLAKAAAAALLDAASKASSSSDLNAVASAANKKVVTIGPFRGLGSDDIPGFTTTGVSRGTFLREAVDLLKSAAPDAPHPTRIIELPREGKVLVARLKSVESSSSKETEYADQIRVTQQWQADLERILQAQWFRYDNVVARVRYQPNVADPDAADTPKPAGQSVPPPRPLGL